MTERKTVWSLGTVTILLTGFFAFVNLNEWYEVTILKQIEGYSFGSEGPSPYYYRTSMLYSTVTFTWGTVFLLNMICAIWSLAKDKRKATMVGFVVSVVFLLVMFIHRQVGAA